MTVIKQFGILCRSFGAGGTRDRESDADPDGTTRRVRADTDGTLAPAPLTLADTYIPVGTQGDHLRREEALERYDAVLPVGEQGDCLRGDASGAWVAKPAVRQYQVPCCQLSRYSRWTSVSES